MLGAAQSPGDTRARLRTWARAIVFITLLVQIWGGPFARQVLGLRHPSTRQWTMFSREGLGIHAVEFRQRDASGKEHRLDRYALLGHDDPRKAPKALRRFTSRRQSYNAARRLCKVLQPRAGAPGGPPDVRIYARYSSPTGWQRADHGQENACTAKAPPDPKNKRKATGKKPRPKPAGHAKAVEGGAAS